MKFNFRKIASVLASTVMVGSSVALAAAANYPAPFVKDGKADVAIVWGTNSAPTDLVAVTDITASLSSALAKQTASGSSGSTSGASTVSGGDFIKLERTNDKYNLGEDTIDFYTSLDNEEMGMVLADGTYLNDNNDEFDYEQTIDVGNLTLSYFKDSSFNDDQPTLGFNLQSGDNVLNYTLDFTDAAEGGTNFADLENTDIEMLGKSFFISSVDTVASNGVKITLLDSANSAIVKEGESKTVTVGSTSYDTTIEAISGSASSPSVKLTVNGETTNSLQEGETYKLSNGVYVGIKDISVRDVAGTVGTVEFSLGTGKIVLENTQEVDVNEDAISDIEDSNGYTSVVTAYITNSSTNIESIKLVWTLDDDAWVAQGTDLVMPGFNTVKMSMGGWNTPSKEVTTVDDDGDAVRISTEIKDGPVKFHLLYANDSVTGFAGTGEDDDHELVANTTTNPSVRLSEANNTYFVATWISGDDAESYVFEIDSIESNDGDNKTTLKNLAGGNDVVLTQVTDTDDKGHIRFTLTSSNDDSKIAHVALSATGSGTVFTDRVVTADGLFFKVPVLNVTASGDGLVNISNNASAPSNPTSFVINFTEEDEDGNIANDNGFRVTVGLDAGDGTEPSAAPTGLTLIENEDNDEIDQGYVISPLATFVSYENPSSGLSKVEITYSGDESFADVFLSEVSASVTTNGTSGTTELGSISVSDSEVSSVSSKNLVVVGGSCVNTVAAELLGSASPLCGAAFEAKTGTGSGAFLIQTFSRSGGKVATLVAGYNADDTTKAAKYLTTQTVDTMVGKKYRGTSATSASLVTETA